MCKLHMKWIDDLGIDTVIDVGANIGQSTSGFRQQFPNARIYSFEPLPVQYNILCEAFKYDNKFVAYNLALSDKEEYIVFNSADFPDASSILSMSDLLKEYIVKAGFFPSAETKEIIVRAATLDSMGLVLGHSLLVKIDVQGADDKVIWGGQETIKKAKLCLIETEFQPLYDGQALFFDILVQMKALGFTYFGDKDRIFYNANGTPLWQDSIFINNNLLKDGTFI